MDEPVVYFIQPASGGAIKIGTTVNLKKRFMALQHASPVPLRIIATVSGGLDVERELHQRFDVHRCHGEWFNPSRELMQFITSKAALLEDAATPQLRRAPPPLTSKQRTEQQLRDKVARLEAQQTRLIAELAVAKRPGICRECHGPCDPGETCCDDCSYCQQCGNVLYEGMEEICEVCEEEMLVDLGLCVSCAQECEDDIDDFCVACREKFMPLEDAS